MSLCLGVVCVLEESWVETTDYRLDCTELLLYRQTNTQAGPPTRLRSVFICKSSSLRQTSQHRVRGRKCGPPLLSDLTCKIHVLQFCNSWQKKTLRISPRYSRKAAINLGNTSVLQGLTLSIRKSLSGKNSNSMYNTSLESYKVLYWESFKTPDCR